MNQQEILNELKHRSLDKPLSLAELTLVREIPYKDLKENPHLQSLIVKYCQDSRFQVRVCEKAFLMTTIVPLLQKDNNVEVIQCGAMCLCFLSENTETHKKLIKAGVIETISLQISLEPHHEILQYSLKLIFNLSNSNVDRAIEKIIQFKIINNVLPGKLELFECETQKSILGIVQNMSKINEESLHRLFIKKKYLSQIMNTMVSPDFKVAEIAVQIIYNLINNGNEQIVNVIINRNIYSKLLLCYQFFKGKACNSLFRQIMLAFEILLIKAFKEIDFEEQFINMAIKMIEINYQDIPYISISCFSQMSEQVEYHDKLYSLNIIPLLVNIMKDQKDQKIRNQASKIISCFSLNPKYLQILIANGFIDLLVNSLNTDDKQQRIFAILSISNLSCSQNFHSNIQNINLKVLIHTLEQIENNDISVLRAAANTLANISIDHFYQQNFLKDPEKSILLKMILNTKDINILKSLVVVFTNICTNTTLIQEMVHNDVLETIFLLFERDYPQLRGYLSRILAQISIVPECRKNILEHNIVNKCIDIMYTSNSETKRQIVLSILMMITYSEDLQTQFLAHEGVKMLLYLMNQQDSFLAYIASKCFVLLTKSDRNLNQIAKKKYVNLQQNTHLKEKIEYSKKEYGFSQILSFINNLNYKSSIISVGQLMKLSKVLIMIVLLLQYLLLWLLVNGQHIIKQ